MFFNASSSSLNSNSKYSYQFTPAGMLGLFIFKKLVTRTQLAHPFTFSPLVMNGKPMVGGLPNRITDGSFTQRLDGWVKDLSKNAPLLIEDYYTKMTPSYWANSSQGSLSNFIFGGEQK
jgi:hypothetical protein